MGEQTNESSAPTERNIPPDSLKDATADTEKGKLAEEQQMNRRHLEGQFMLTAAEKLGVSETSLRAFFANGTPVLPRDASPEITVFHLAVSGEWAQLRQDIAQAVNKQTHASDIASIRTRLDEYVKDFAAYEKACKAFGKERFIQEFGFPADMTSAEIDMFLADITAPLPKPIDAKKEENRTDTNLQESYQEIESARLEISQKLPLFLLHGSTDPLREKMVNYMMKRDVYERKVLEKPSDTASWALYMGVLVNELGEEVLEGSIGFTGKELQSFAPETRLNIVRGWKALTAKLAAKGVPVESLGNVLGTLHKSPLGPTFWGELMAIESPVTVLLWAYYMHTSDDKFKACVQFGSFIAVSSVSNKLIGGVEALLARMGIGLKIPGAPALKFAAALALAFVSSDKIDQFSTWADTKLWPDSQFKHDALVDVGFFTGDAAMGQGYESIEAMGLMTVNPETDMDAFFKRENVLPDHEADTLDRSYYQTVEAWNSRVDRAIAVEKNPIKKKLWEEEKISDPLLWGERMSVRLYAQVSALKTIEQKLAYGLWKKGLIADRAVLNGLDLATSDEGDLRNDRVLGMALGSGELSSIRVYMEGGVIGSRTISSDSPLLPLWNAYKASLTEIAKSVSIYKHLGIYPPKTGRNQWLGDITSKTQTIPAQVERGLVEEIAYRNKRKRAIGSGNHTEGSSADYAGNLVEAVPFVEPQTIFQWLNLAESETEQQQADLDMFKAFVRVNAKYFHGKELDTVLQPMAARALSGQPATYEDLRAVYERMSDFLFERSLKEKDIQSLPPKDLQALRIHPRLSFEQRGIYGREREQVLDLLKQDGAFIHSLGGDCLLMRTAEYSSFVRVECLVIYGRSSDRSTWMLSNVTTLLPRTLEKGHYVYGERQTVVPRNIPYTEWMKAHPRDESIFALPFDALEAANRRSEQKIPKKAA